MLLLIKLLFCKKYFGKISWCLQNFLTMEFYRKICDNCYWSNIYNSKHSLIKQSLILFVSFIPVLFLSFFYIPRDPANINNFAYSISLRNFLSGFRISLLTILDNMSIKILKFSTSLIDSLQIKFTSKNILELKTSLVI